MKVIPSALAAHYAKACTTVATFLKVTRADAVVLGFTSLDHEITVDGLAYEPGFDVSGLASTESLAVDNLELSILPDEASVPVADLMAGLWNNAAFEVFECNYEAPADGINVLKRGTTGEVRLRRGIYTIEFRSLTQALQQTQGIVTSKTCRARLGDGKCKKSLTTFTYSSTLSAVASRQVFTDSARAEADEWFAEGVITFTSGANDGYSQKVKSFSAGEFTLSLPLPFLPAVGDAYTVITGCRKRLDEDCRAKFNNVLNFQGEPHLPGIDALSKKANSDSQPADSPPILPPEGLDP